MKLLAASCVGVTHAVFCVLPHGFSSKRETVRILNVEKKIDKELFFYFHTGTMLKFDQAKLIKKILSYTLYTIHIKVFTIL